MTTALTASEIRKRLHSSDDSRIKSIASNLTDYQLEWIRDAFKYGLADAVRGGRVFRGSRDSGQAVVTFAGKPLDPRLDLRCHSPTGVEWGYMGSGPAQLALAILAAVLPGDAESALELYHDYKREVVGFIRQSDWVLSEDDVLGWVKKQGDKR